MRVAVLISGSGTNLQALIDAVDLGHLDCEMVAVISNRQKAYGLQRAADANIPTQYFPLKPYKDADKSRQEYDADLANLVKQYLPDLIVLAGWMHILSPAFLDEFPKRVINLHPALPNQFAGTNAIERAYEAAQNGEITHSGVMVHHAIPEVDAGAVIIQAEVPILQDDSLDDFANRMHATEHQLIVKAVALMAEQLK